MKTAMAATTLHTGHRQVDDDDDDDDDAQDDDDDDDG